MWQVSTWCYKLSNHNTKFAAYRLTDCKAVIFPPLFGVICHHITPESTTLHPITDIVQGLVFEYISGISIAKLNPGVDVSEQEAERISSHITEALHAIETENCILHNDMDIGNVVLQDGSRSPVIIDF